MMCYCSAFYSGFELVAVQFLHKKHIGVPVTSRIHLQTKIQDDMVWGAIAYQLIVLYIDVL